MEIIDVEICDVQDLSAKGGVPSVVSRHDDRTNLILELISGYINDEVAALKPCMRIAISLAKYTVKHAVAILLQILGKKESGIATSTMGEGMHSKRKGL